MRVVKLSAIVLACSLVIVTSGCVSPDQYEQMKVQNRIQQERLAELESQLSAANLQLGQFGEQLAAAQSRYSAQTGSLQEEIKAIEKTLGQKRALIAKLNEQLLRGGGALPVELSVKLEDFAKQNEIVTYDSSKGMLKFKSDLLFERGSDKVAPNAIGAIKSLCKIVNSQDGKDFDIVVAGHTDDIPIQKPDTRAKHPTNWHLSAHRAIAVLKVMTANAVSPKRLSARGFGEYRPVAENKPKKGGNPKNRRVEIYIVPSGT